MNTSRLASLLVVLALLAGTGCTHTSYQDTSGNKFTRTSFGTTQNIGRLFVKAGDKELTMDNYSNEQAQVASAVVTAAIQATKK